MPESRFQWPIIGHHNIINYLQYSILADKVAQAYLFFGPAQIGKTTVTENFVTSLVCENLHQKTGPVPCHQCQCCQQVENKVHPDILWLEREVKEKTGKLKKNISIEQIRELQNRLSLHSFLNSYKVAVIQQAESLSQEAANSLLKILEEPPPRTVLILLTNNIAVIPQTIISRCQVLKFLPVAEAEIFKHLTDNLKVNRKKAKAFATSAYGQPGIAIDYFNDSEIFTDYQQKVKNFISLHQVDLLARFKLVREINNFFDLSLTQEILNIWTKIVRDLLLIRNSNKDLVNNLSFMTELEQLADLYDNQKLIQISRELDLAKSYLGANVNPKLILENLILDLPHHSVSA